MDGWIAYNLLFTNSDQWSYYFLQQMDVFVHSYLHVRQES